MQNEKADRRKKKLADRRRRDRERSAELARRAEFPAFEFDDRHADPEFAHGAGFPAPILHGLCSWGIVLRTVTDDLLGGDAARVGAFTARFAGVVFPGETIRVQAWERADDIVVSNGSCTTNALAPLLKTVDDLFGIIGGQMTTVHCYTGSQPTVDQPRDDFARSRAAALSMVPTSTSAHKLVGKVLPSLAGKIEARAIRVPTASVSAIDLTVSLEKAPSLSEARDKLKSAIAASPVIGWIEKPLVSVDLRARPESLVVSGPELSVSAGGLLRVFGWYDNEWGFANRMIDVASLMANS